MIENRWISKHVLQLVYSPSTNKEENIQNLLQLSGEEAFQDVHYILSDWSRYPSTELDLSAEDAEELAKLAKTLKKTTKSLNVVLCIHYEVESIVATASLFKLLL